MSHELIAISQRLATRMHKELPGIKQGKNQKQLPGRSPRIISSSQIVFVDTKNVACRVV